MSDTPSTIPLTMIRQKLNEIIDDNDFRDQRVLIIVPDSTRTTPLHVMFPVIRKQLGAVARSINVLVALGTHPPMSQNQIRRMLGIAQDDPCEDIALHNHEWDNDAALTTIGTLTEDETRELSGGDLVMEVPVEINRRILDCDVVLVVGPVFPHEVVGFSGGNKYFFPGISGPRLLNFFHWLGALITNVEIIGVRNTPVRRVVDRAARLIKVKRRCLAFVVASDASPYAVFYGSPEDAWQHACDISEQVHIKRFQRPYHQVLSCAPGMYEDLWVAGKCMYKLEPVVADGGELIIYAPHIKDVSITHGRLIRQIGYHVKDYFTEQWNKFKDYPWSVLAHSSHVRGGGDFIDGVENPRITVTLASQIPAAVCRQLNLGWRDPESIDIESFADREDDGVLLVRRAGEHLHRLHDGISTRPVVV